MARVLIVRGHNATPWELRPWLELPERYDVAFLKTGSNGYDTSTLAIDAIPVTARRDRFPRNALGEIATGLLRDRYSSSADAAFAEADIVHAAELAFWFAADAARRKSGNRFRLVQTVWETLPFGTAYRTKGACEFREAVLTQTDLFLAATDRARVALLLEGVPEEKIRVSSPGIDVARFGEAAAFDAPHEHVIIAPGRLVWEKGHQDLLRAVAMIRRGIVPGVSGSTPVPRVRIVGSGPERSRLEAHATELGIRDLLTIESLPYEEMPRAFHEASCLVLGSLSTARGGLHPFDIPRFFWEEQFGMVFAEAMAASLPIITTTSGAIPEVMNGAGTLFAPGDYVGLAQALARGPLAHEPGRRAEYDPALVESYSTSAAASRLTAAYDELLA
jgi:glycosyltransferase involved in cell wall biosynthesis